MEVKTNKKPKEEQKKMPFLERWGLSMFYKLSAKNAAKLKVDTSKIDDNDVHILTPDEKRALDKVQRDFVLRSAFAGVISALIAAIAAYYAYPIADQTVKYWAIVGGVTIVCSAIEILFIYWDGIRSVHNLAVKAGLQLFPDGTEHSEIALVMARAALEIPNPMENDYEIDCLKESSKIKLFFASMLYKAKITLTNFIAKMVIRRMIGRAVAKELLEFVAVPVAAVWNGAVAYMVIREAKIRALGPSAAKELVDSMVERQERWTLECKLECFRAIALCMVRSANQHPNLLYMIKALAAKLDIDIKQYDIDEHSEFMQGLSKMTYKEQRTILKVLLVAVIIDGRMSRKEIELLKEAVEACKIKVDFSALKLINRKFKAGKEITTQDFNQFFV